MAVARAFTIVCSGSPFRKTPDVVLLKLEGRITGPWVEELRKAWLASANMAGGQPISIDLGAVSFIDATGQDLILRMQREGVALKGASSFLRQVLEDRNTNSKHIGKIGAKK